MDSSNNMSYNNQTAIEESKVGRKTKSILELSGFNKMNNSVRTGTGAGVTMINNSANKTVISNDRFFKING